MSRILQVAICNPLYPITVKVLHQIFSPCGFVEKIIILPKTSGLRALVQFPSQQVAAQARNTMKGRTMYDGSCTLDIQYSNLSELHVQLNNERTRDYTNLWLPPKPGMPAVFRPAPYRQMPLGGSAAAAALFGGVLPPGISGTNDRSTLIVSNLNAEQLDADKLFNLLSNYGNVVRIKFMHSKPDHALVQMGDGLQAELVVHFLKGAMLLGNRMEIDYSKHPQINLSANAHDYSSSSLNRFHHNVPKNLRFCCAPTKMIHVSSLPNHVDATDITDHLAPRGHITEAKLFEINGKKQALVLFESEEEATEALVCKHASFFHGQTIRLAFSKSTSV